MTGEHKAGQLSRPGRVAHPVARSTTRSRLAAAGWVGLAAVALLVGAGVVIVGGAGVAFGAGSGIGAVRTFAARLTDYVTAVAASIAVLFLAYNGVRWTMSGGHPVRQAEARHGLIAAGAGLVVALSANLIVALVVAALR